MNMATAVAALPMKAYRARFLGPTTGPRAPYRCFVSIIRKAGIITITSAGKYPWASCRDIILKGLPMPCSDQACRELCPCLNIIMTAPATIFTPPISTNWAVALKVTTLTMWWGLFFASSINFGQGLQNQRPTRAITDDVRNYYLYRHDRCGIKKGKGKGRFAPSPLGV